MVDIAVFLTPEEGLTVRLSDGPDGFIGARRAMDGWIRAMLRAEGVGRVFLFCEPEHLSAVDARVSELPSRAAAITASTRDAARLLRELPDVVVCHPGQLTPPALWRWRSRVGLTRVPIASMHHTLSYPSVGWALGQTLALDVRPYDCIVAASTDAGTAIEAMIGECAPATWRGRTAVIPLGVDVGEFGAVPDRAARRSFGLAAESFVALWVGRFSPVDKADLLPLLVAFRGFVTRTGARARLVLAGADPLGYAGAVPRLTRCAGLGDQVVVLTDVPSTELPGLYGCADVFVSPVDNVQEAFGLTVVEAMAAGLPPVVSDWAGYRDTVTDEAGVRIPTSWGYPGPDPAWDEDDHRWRRTHFTAAMTTAVDVAALSAALEALYRDPRRRRAMGEAARSRAERLYDWDVVAAAHVELYTRLSAMAAETAESPPPPARGLAHRFAHYASTRDDGAGSIVATGPAPFDVAEAADICGLADLLDLKRLTRLYDLSTVDGGVSPARAASALGVTEREFALGARWLVKTGLCRPADAASGRPGRADEGR